MGPMVVEKDSWDELISYASEDGSLRWEQNEISEKRVGQMLQLIVSLRDYQFA